MESEFTANHYLSLPAIETAPPAIRCANVLLAGLDGLLEWSAGDGPDGLVMPRLTVDGASIELGAADWDRLDRWLPRFRATSADLAVTGTVCPLAGHDARARGALWILDIENRGAERTIQVAFKGSWLWSRLRVASARPLLTPNRLVRGRTPDGIALEAGPDGRCGALAMLLLGRDVEYLAGAGTAGMRTLAPGEQLEAANGSPIEFVARRPLRLAAGARNRCVLVLAAGPERDGALAAAAAAAATGAEHALREMRLELARVARTAEGPDAEIAVRNLLYAHFCGIARAVDDDRLYPVRSRSHRHHAAGTMDEREALSGMIPLLVGTDRLLARELLERIMEQYSDRPGNPSRYITGGVLTPGFALDTACALVIAIDRYVTATADEPLLLEPITQTVLREADEMLWQRLHPDVFLASTEVLPSGERPDHPWVAYDNALLWAVCGAIERCWRSELPPLLAGRADEAAAAFWQRLTTDLNGTRVIACSTDLAGEAAVYDDPRGSLAALPALGFCDVTDPIWENTLDLLRSAAYPFWLGDRPHPGLAGRSSPREASMAALCADLATPRRDATLAVLRRLRLPGGVAAETWDPDTGEAARGPFAAGLAAALALALRPEPPPARGRKPR